MIGMLIEKTPVAASYQNKKATPLSKVALSISCYSNQSELFVTQRRACFTHNLFRAAKSRHMRLVPAPGLEPGQRFPSEGF
jgi:hypothetical protein